MDEIKEMTADQVLADYIDEEGYLCCGKCRTRKQYMVKWPLFDGTGKTENRLMPVSCSCEKAAAEIKEAREKEKKHKDEVARLKSVCFTSPLRTEQTFEHATMIPEDILEKAKSFVEHWDTVKKENTGSLYWGDCGTGKSYTAACIANALMEQEVPVLMRNMADFMNASFEDREELCREIAKYGLVIFDDFGMERGTEYGLETVYRVVNARCESGRPTVFTTNLSLQDLMNPKDMAHKRIYDRVLEMTVPIHFGGPSVRPTIHQHKMSIFKRFFKGGK